MGRDPVLRRVVVLVVVASVFAGCSQPRTAGNATVDFMIAIDGQEYERAYERLCERLRAPQSSADFTSARGGRFAVIAALPGAASVADVDPSDPETMHRAVSRATVEITGTADPEKTAYTLDLVREGGAWRICGISPVP